MASQSPELKIIAPVAAAVPTVFTSVAAMATDGTNAWCGVDDTRLLLAVLLVVLIIQLNHYYGMIALFILQVQHKLKYPNTTASFSDPLTVYEF